MSTDETNEMAFERDLALRQAKLAKADLQVIQMALNEARPLEALRTCNEAIDRLDENIDVFDDLDDAREEANATEDDMADEPVDEATDEEVEAAADGESVPEKRWEMYEEADESEGFLAPNPNAGEEDDSGDEVTPPTDEQDTDPDSDEVLPEFEELPGKGANDDVDEGDELSTTDGSDNPDEKPDHTAEDLGTFDVRDYGSLQLPISGSALHHIQSTDADRIHVREHDGRFEVVPGVADDWPDYKVGVDQVMLGAPAVDVLGLNAGDEVQARADGDVVVLEPLVDDQDDEPVDDDDQGEDLTIWCGICGDGSFATDEAFETHHEEADHGGDPIALDHEPSEDELVGDGPDAVHDGREDADEFQVGDDLDNVDEAEADGGVVETPDSAFELPDDITEADVDTAIAKHGPQPYLEDIGDELGVSEGRARLICFHLNRYSDVSEGRDRGGQT